MAKYTCPFVPTDVHVWKYITDLSMNNVDPNRYKINEVGDIYDTSSNRILNHSIDDEGYHRVHLHTKNGFKQTYVHRIVKIEFDGICDNMNRNQVDHLDTNKSNNFIMNLDWVTKSENAYRGIDSGNYYQINVKISEDDVELVCKLLSNGYSYQEINNILKPKYNQDMTRIIGKIYRRERWKKISDKYPEFPKLNKSKGELQ